MDQRPLGAIYYLADSAKDELLFANRHDDLNLPSFYHTSDYHLLVKNTMGLQNFETATNCN